VNFQRSRALVCPTRRSFTPLPPRKPAKFQPAGKPLFPSSFAVVAVQVVGVPARRQFDSKEFRAFTAEETAEVPARLQSVSKHDYYSRPTAKSPQNCL